MAGGIAIGLAIGLAVAAGVVIGQRDDGDAASRFPIEELKLKAYSAHGSETFAIATGPVDGTVDGVFCLDFIKGDLTGYVINPRVGKFTAAFKTNVVQNGLPPEQGKTTRYAMALGRMSTVSTYSNIKPGSSIIYVADCNTGMVAAYAFPWNDALSRNPPSNLVAAKMVLVDIAKARDLPLRDQ
jgi:hypothetical protein